VKKISISLFLVSMLMPAGFVYSGNYAQQIVSFSIQPVSVISVSGDPAMLIVDTLDPEYPYSDFDLVPAVDESTTYALTTNFTFKITGELSQAMTYGTWLFVKLEEPQEGYSIGYVALNNNSGGKLPAQTLLVGDPMRVSGKKIYYKLGADVVSGPIQSGQNVVTLTVVEL
jgi:hypothetical protein